MQVIRRKKKTGPMVPLLLVTIVLVLLTAFLFVYVIQNEMAFPTQNTGEGTIASPVSSQNELVSSQEPEESISVSMSEPEPTEIQMPEDRYLLLVNAEYKIPDDFVLDLVDYDTIQMDREVLAAYQQMHTAAVEDGINLWISSAYRSIDLQEKLFQQEIETNLEAGMTEEEAEAAAEMLVQRPGYSEHATGFAIDFNGVTTDFEHDEAYQWLLQHAEEYGFILRYPLDKVEFTGIDYEPWHYRYVGPENAKEINRLGFCLEEYVVYLSEQAQEEASQSESN